MLLATPGAGAPPQPGSPDGIGGARRRRRQRQSEAAGPRRRHADPAGERQQGDRRRADRARQRRRGPAGGRRQPSAVDDANAAITAAQQRFDTFAASTYVNGPSASYLTATDPADIIDTAAAGQTLSVSSQQVITNLQRARTEQVNKESAARLAKQKADQAVADAQTSQETAVSALTQAQQTFGDQQAELDQLTAERSAAQAKLDAGRATGRRRRRGQPAATARRGARLATAASRTGTARPLRRDPAAGNWDNACGIRRCPRSRAHSSAATRSRSSTRCSASRPPRRRSPSTWAATSCRSSESCPTPSGFTNGAIPARLRQAGLRVRDPARHVADGRALLVGWRQRGRAEHAASTPVPAQSDSTAQA